MAHGTARTNPSGITVHWREDQRFRHLQQDSTSKTTRTRRCGLLFGHEHQLNGYRSDRVSLTFCPESSFPLQREEPSLMVESKINAQYVPNFLALPRLRAFSKERLQQRILAASIAIKQDLESGNVFVTHDQRDVHLEIKSIFVGILQP